MDKKENIKKILEKIQEAEYVLVGLGQYFDMQYFLSMQEGYREIIEKLQESHALWIEPYVDTCCRKQFAPKLEDEMTSKSGGNFRKKKLFCCIYVYQSHLTGNSLEKTSH